MALKQLLHPYCNEPLCVVQIIKLAGFYLAGAPARRLRWEWFVHITTVPAGTHAWRSYVPCMRACAVFGYNDIKHPSHWDIILSGRPAARAEPAATFQQRI